MRSASHSTRQPPPANEVALGAEGFGRRARDRVRPTPFRHGLAAQGRVRRQQAPRPPHQLDNIRLFFGRAQIALDGPDHEENKRGELLERAAASAAQLIKEVSAPNKSD